MQSIFFRTLDLYFESNSIQSRYVLQVIKSYDRSLVFLLPR
ncbi:hypothetical protein LINGRAHAP2_LOCUS23450, partial [Linum grandiflorum]